MGSWVASTRRACRRVAAAVTLGLFLAAGAAGARAQDVEMLAREFDSGRLIAAETRLLQVGLASAGGYRGLIDGRWGRASQRAFERYLRREGIADADGLVRTYHAAILGSAALDFVEANGLGYRGGAPDGHLLLAPPGPFVPDLDTALDDRVLVAQGLEIRTFRSDMAVAARLHQSVEADLEPWLDPYRLRTDHRWVTAADAGARLFHVRTDYAPETNLFFTTTVRELEGADRALYRVVVAGIGQGWTASLEAPAGGLRRAMTDVWALAAAAAGETGLAAAAPAVPAPLQGPRADAVGTAFYVNNYELVTAGHVVDACATLHMADGTPLHVVVRHPALDLAVLSAPVRSDAWIALSADGSARLGQRIFILGYPYFGTYGTALNMTAGNVSALAGIDDAPEALTISAPVQPGNSGGPLLGRDGAAIGVVVARLDGLKVAEETGTLPENVNYAISGTALLAFLDAAMVSIPRGRPSAMDVEDGVPDAMQRAVIPVICRG